MDKIKILLVDDNHYVLNSLERILEGSYDVRIATDGESAIKKATAEKPALIILDIILPGINGFEVCRKLKEDSETRDIPVIMLTALGREKDLSQGLEKGASCFITKPFNPQDLLAEIEKNLDKE